MLKPILLLSILASFLFANIPLLNNTTTTYTKEDVVYNLTVANDHTYFVGRDGVLGHNAGCWDEISEALNNMGMDNLYIDRNKVAHVSVIYTDNLDLKEIGKLKTMVKSVGAEKISVESGPIINSTLKRILEKKAQQGRSYKGGKVIKADGIINDFILEFHL